MGRHITSTQLEMLRERVRALQYSKKAQGASREGIEMVACRSACRSLPFWPHLNRLEPLRWHTSHIRALQRGSKAPNKAPNKALASVTFA